MAGIQARPTLKRLWLNRSEHHGSGSGGPDRKEAGPQRGGEEVYPAGAEDAEAKTRSSFSSRNWPFSATCCIKSHLNLRAAGCRFLLSRQTLQPCKHTQARSGENRWNRRNKRAQTDSLIGGGGQTKASDIGAGAEGLYGSII